MSEPVGIIGLGLLGSALARRLMSLGGPVIGFDPDESCCERFRAGGGTPVEDASTVAEQCRRIVLSLPESSVSRRVIDEVRPHLKSDAVIIDTTTGDPAEMQAIGDELAADGIGYLDATVAGSSVQARQGAVLVLIGGDDNHAADARELIDAISARSIHVGPRGSGARMKLVVNLLLGLNRAALAEGLTFAKSIGIDPAVALNVLQDSPAVSGIMETKGEKMVTGDFTPQARLRQHVKDVRLILEAAQSPTPFSELHAELLQSLVDRGYGDEDNSAIVRAFEDPDSE